jgi:hypothetical protein
MGPQQGWARWSAERGKRRHGRGRTLMDGAYQAATQSGGGSHGAALMRGTKGSTDQLPREGKGEGERGRLPGGPWLSGLSSTPSRVHGQPCPTARGPSLGRVVRGQGGGATGHHGHGGGRKRGEKRE